ncbi:MAG: hypothetical protein HC841_02000, partial [Verrucomicrobiae bacterium]|nr:hypothetical protein [Verrucomicrobiae bacterium]
MKTRFAFACLPQFVLLLLFATGFNASVRAGTVTILSLNASAYSTPEGGSITVTVTREPKDNPLLSTDWFPTQPRSVGLQLSTSGHTYGITSGDLPSEWSDFSHSVTIPANQTSTSFTINFNSNTNLQFDRTATLRFGGAIVDESEIQEAMVTLFDDDSTVEVFVLETPPFISEGGQVGPATAQLVFQRNVSVHNRTINFTKSGTASAADYSMAGSVTIADGSAFTLVPVTALNDGLIEGTESLVVTLTSGHYQIHATNSAATLYIRDADAYSSVNVEATDGHASEAGNAGIFRISRTGNTNVAVTALLSYGGTAVAGSDYTALPTNVTFAVGQTQTNLVVSAAWGGGGRRGGN